MKSLILLILSTLMVSCSFVARKNVTDRHFSVKQYDLNNKVHPYTIAMIKHEELNQNCFPDIDDREIFTVPKDYAFFAIDHFYKRSVNVDVKVVNRNGGTRVDVTTKESINFDLEVFDCLVEKQYWFLKFNTTYTSFRIKR